MELLRGFDSLDPFRGGFLSIGNFDGVHRGHQQMLACLVRHAQEHNVPACVFTFEPHPIQLLRPEHCPPALTSLDQKAELIEACGVDCMVVYQTDLRLLNL
ncbi:MAG: bifunctional riboflavin kinase/FAD synthetase, partial [Planctomycetota bacterium]|nr:bifunctional riboflavin kinase/FAD synthetase [Planctomycetota bacterium]